MYSISYVIPTLNSGKTLDATILSLKSQVNVKVNIIVVDSGSTDSTLEICSHWNVQCLYVPPGNMYAAINVGISECNTEWVGYINSDDYLYPNSVSRLLRKGTDDSSDIVYGVCDYVDFQGRFMYSFYPPQPKEIESVAKIGPIGFAQQTAIFKKIVFSQLDGFQDKYKFSADKDFFVRAIRENYKFSFLPNPSSACFRIHGNQLSQVQMHKMIQEGVVIDSAILSAPTLLDYLVFYKWRMLNLPYYALRLLRRSLLSERIEMGTSMSSFDKS
jgi:glycosyltransferase involved in cell wall biosynthesis